MNADRSSQAALMRRIGWAGFALMLLVTTSSAYLRLRAAGLGCEDWPQCYGQYVQGTMVAPIPGVAVARVAHRVCASAAGALALLLVAVAYARRRVDAPALWASVALVVLAGMLAYLGRVTPQARFAAVAMGNLLGGMSMTALFMFVAVRREGHRDTGSAATWPLAGTALALTCLQLAYGAMTSASYSGLACTTFPDCAGAWWPSDATWSAFNPWRAISRDEISANMTLHMMHRYGGLLLGLIALWLALRLIRRKAGGWGMALLTLVALQWVIGSLMVEQSLPVSLALAHNVAAALLLALLTAIAARHGRCEGAP